MVKRKTCRSIKRRIVRKSSRRLAQATTRDLFPRSRSLDDMSHALKAFRRAIRAHRNLARLAPEFFDSTVTNRLARQRVADAKWLASWEPALNKVYGPPSEPPHDPLTDLPPVPRSPRTCRAVERELAAWHLWMQAGKLALARHEQRRPHALISFGRIARLLEIGMDFARLACGSTEPETNSEMYSHDRALQDLERIFGREPEEPTIAKKSPSPPAPDLAPASPPPAPAPAPVSSLRPADTKRDFKLCSLVIGPHGLLCLHPIE